MASNARVGEHVDAYCRRCKLVLDATVAAMIDNDVISVVCRTCGERQRFKTERPKASPRQRRVVEVQPTRKPRLRSVTPARQPRSLPQLEAVEPPTPKISAEDAVTAAVSARWRKATDGVHSRFARPHRREDSYCEGELILHKAHGMGVVEAVDRAGPLTVLFRSGLVQLDGRASNAATP